MKRSWWSEVLVIIIVSQNNISKALCSSQNNNSSLKSTASLFLIILLEIYIDLSSPPQHTPPQQSTTINPSQYFFASTDSNMLWLYLKIKAQLKTRNMGRYNKCFVLKKKETYKAILNFCCIHVKQFLCMTYFDGVWWRPYEGDYEIQPQ